MSVAAFGADGRSAGGLTEASTGGIAGPSSDAFGVAAAGEGVRPASEYVSQTRPANATAPAVVSAMAAGARPGAKDPWGRLGSRWISTLSGCAENVCRRCRTALTSVSLGSIWERFITWERSMLRNLWLC